MRSYQVDMCNGPIFKKLIIFCEYPSDNPIQ
jgi:hypothetical protein